MNGQILTGRDVTTGRRKPSDLVAEYEAKRGAASNAVDAWNAAQRAVLDAATLGGCYPGFSLNTGNIDERDVHRALLRSAWRHCYALYGLGDIASAKDKARIERMFEQPPEFCVENIREQFGEFVADPWRAILRGLAEVFAGLDPAFKSHERMKIGVKGLPKRVIIENVRGYGVYGRDQLRDILNALAAYQRKPLVTYCELSAIIVDDGECLRHDGILPEKRHEKAQAVVGRGVWLKTHQNGNGHLYFDEGTLRDVNRALAEFYGVVLPDCPEWDGPRKASTKTDVAADLQYYPTPVAIVERVLSDVLIRPGERVLEPSCGCGRIMDGLRQRGARAFGIEFDGGRADQCRAKGHDVLRANFLETPPSPEFDAVVMNPPFYGRHYEKHVRHALRWLKPGGRLTAILPASARYDHHGLDDLTPRWDDLPVGSFRESGAWINTTVASVSVREALA